MPRPVRLLLLAAAQLYRLPDSLAGRPDVTFALRVPPAGLGEVETHGDLALGLEASTVYEEHVLTLHEGDHLTVMTDGVPEATQHGRWLGFDRAALLSVQGAGAIAKAAQAFGQSDDITVLTIDVRQPQRRQRKPGRALFSALPFLPRCETS